LSAAAAGYIFRENVVCPGINPPTLKLAIPPSVMMPDTHTQQSLQQQPSANDIAFKSNLISIPRQQQQQHCYMCCNNFR
jgi:hypothetical protein